MAFSRIQGKQGSGATASLVTNLDTTATQGTLIVVNIKILTASITVTSITDSVGNTYALAAGPIDNASLSGGSRAYQYYGVQVTGGATSVTINLSGSGSIRADIEEYSGGAASNAAVFDVAATAKDPGSTQTSASLSLTPSAAGELIVVGLSAASITSIVAGTNYTLGVNNGLIATQYRLSGTTSETAPISWTGASNWIEIAGAYKQPVSSTQINRTLLGVG